MNGNRQQIHARPAEERVRDFDEVTECFTPEQASAEARRCLNCKNAPCVKGCPVGVGIPSFIAEIKAGDYSAAYAAITRDNTLPAVCGRVCPQESQCEGKCVLGVKGEAVAIGALERFAATYGDVGDVGDVVSADVDTVADARKIAVIGSGPAGLACAGELSSRGCDVTVYEALHKAGGVLMYGIPEFRLPKSVVEAEIDKLRRRGVKFVLNAPAGLSFDLTEIMEREGYTAVFIGTGAGLPSFMGIRGESLPGVVSANEYLTRVNLMKGYTNAVDTPVPQGRRVAVIGGGNVAMDAARSALRMGAERVYIVYRRSEAELPARSEEVEHAKEEGVIFRTLCCPVAINGDTAATSVTCIRTELGEPDERGRRRPVDVAGSEFDIDVDLVIMAIGTSPNPVLTSRTPVIGTDVRGRIIADCNGQCLTRDGERIAGLYAGGDSVTGAATVILAMGAGKTAAAEILGRKEQFAGVGISL